MIPHLTGLWVRYMHMSAFGCQLIAAVCIYFAVKRKSALMAAIATYFVLEFLVEGGMVIAGMLVREILKHTAQ